MTMKQKLSVFENTMNYLFKPRETRDLDNVNRMRKKYEKMGIKRLENLLIVYEARIKKSQQIFTGIILVIFTALLGGFGTGAFKWVQKLLIVRLGSNSAIVKYKLSNQDKEMVLIFEGLLVLVIVFFIVLGIIWYVNKIKDEQKIILFLKKVITDKNNEKEFKR